VSLTRRQFVAAACALCAGCRSQEPAPAPQPAASQEPPPADPAIALPAGLNGPGDSARATLPSGEDVLVWKTTNGYGAASPWCTHKGGELFYDAELGQLRCPSHGSRFFVDGAVARGPAESPLKAWKVRREGESLRFTARNR
jgi:Rieske Fe-S protein